MWKNAIALLLFAALFLTIGSGKALAQSHTVGQTFSSLFFLDGKNVVEYKEVSLGLDDIVRFDAYELLPGTVLNVKVSGTGIKTFEATYPTNQRGEAKTTLFFPKARGRLTVNVKFTTKNGNPEQIRFYLMPAY